MSKELSTNVYKDVQPEPRPNEVDLCTGEEIIEACPSLQVYFDANEWERHIHVFNDREGLRFKLGVTFVEVYKTTRFIWDDFLKDYNSEIFYTGKIIGGLETENLGHNVLLFYPQQIDDFVLKLHVALGNITPSYKFSTLLDCDKKVGLTAKIRNDGDIIAYFMAVLK